MRNRLRIGRGLTFPVDAVTQTFVIFGKRGSGKSNTAVVMAEEMHAIGAPFVVLDPVSAWWGLKSSFDGSGEGLPVYVFGGPHADLPLEPTAGELMAQLFIEHRIPMILDMKGWTGGERARFVTAFALHLLGHNDRVPAHVFLEEADAFIPQRPYTGEEAMLGAMDRLVRWGRQEGLGVTAVTQRSAKINKDVTTQAETLIAHRTTGPQDREAIDNWIRFHAGDEERQAVLASLPTLPSGTAWIWSPEWLELLRQVVIRRRETYDSAGTPKIGEKRIQPKALAEVDLDQLRDRMAATIEKAEAVDPTKLQARIRQLEREAAQRPAERVTETVTEVVEVPVLNGEVDQLRKVVEDLASEGRVIAAAASTIVDVGGRIVAAIDRVGQSATPQGGRVKQAPRGEPASRPDRGRGVSAVATPASPATSRAPAPSHPLAEGEARTLGRAERALLNVLAQFPDGRTKQQISVLSGYSIRSSSFANALGALRSAGLAEGRDPIVITDAGIAAASDVEPLPTGQALLDHWRGQLGRAERSLLDVLVDAYPAALTKEEISERSGYSLTSSSFANALGKLRTLQLADGYGETRATDVLFEGGR